MPKEIMPKVSDIINIIESFAPQDKAYNKEYDNVGLIVGDKNAEAGTVLCCLDVTNDVIAQAEKNNAKMIVCHHPVIYLPHLSRITTDTALGAKLIRLIKSGISVFAAHTNLDFVKGGINEFAAQLLGLTGLVPLDPYISRSEGFGRAGALAEETLCSVLADRAAQVFKDPRARLIGKDKSIKKAAVINGGGGGGTEYVDTAIAAGAECLITGDIKHHVAAYALDLGFPLIEVSHFACEHIYIKRLADIITAKAAAAGLDIRVLQAEESLD